MSVSLGRMIIFLRIIVLLQCNCSQILFQVFAALRQTLNNNKLNNFRLENLIEILRRILQLGFVISHWSFVIGITPNDQ